MATSSRCLARTKTRYVRFAVHVRGSMTVKYGTAADSSDSASASEESSASKSNGLPAALASAAGGGACETGTADGSACGIAMSSSHSGHWTVFPAADSGICSRFLHVGHTIDVGPVLIGEAP